MASENRGWDTSTALIRRVFRACIEYGRRARGREGDDLWEAYRLMGTGLHTMEDLLAHSNWCELGLRKLGYNDVFCHVGDNGEFRSPVSVLVGCSDLFSQSSSIHRTARRILWSLERSGALVGDVLLHS